MILISSAYTQTLFDIGEEYGSEHDLIYNNNKSSVFVF